MTKRKTNFRLDMASQGDQDLLRVKHPEMVIDLHIENASITDEGMEIVARMQILEGAHLQKCGISDRGVKYLSNCASLKAVCLCDLQISDASVMELRQCLSLTSLVVSLCPVTGEWGCCENWERLESVSLSHTHLSDAGLSQVLELPALTTFSGIHTRVESISSAVHSNSIQFLYLDDTRVSNRGVGRIAEAFPKLRNLAVARTAIDGGCIQDLVQLDELRQLRLSGNNVSFKDLKALAECKQLELLEVRNCDLTVSQVKSLKSMHSRGLWVIA